MPCWFCNWIPTALFHGRLFFFTVFSSRSVALSGDFVVPRNLGAHVELICPRGTKIGPNPSTHMNQSGRSTHNLDEIIAQLRQRIVELKSTLQFERAVQSKERTELLRRISVIQKGQEQASWQEQPEQQHLEIQRQMQLQQHKSSTMRLNLKSNQIDHLKAQLKAQKRRYQQLLRTTNIEISKERHKCLTLERRLQQLSALVEQLPSMIAHIEQSSQDIVNRIKHERDVLSP
mgnify:CR=1 FL=1